MTAMPSFRELADFWPRLGKMWPLVVRVLACSRPRLKLRPQDHHKPWLCLANLLVADKTAYCVLTVWDQAVQHCHSPVREGDILVLEGSYKLAKFQPTNKTLIHRLKPKLRGHGLSDTEFEIKLNMTDLDRVVLVRSTAAAPMLPTLDWNFVPLCRVHQLTVGRVVDVVGIVAHLGRWERECMSSDPGQNLYTKFKRIENRPGW